MSMTNQIRALSIYIYINKVALEKIYIYLFIVYLYLNIQLLLQCLLCVQLNLSHFVLFRTKNKTINYKYDDAS